MQKIITRKEFINDLYEVCSLLRAKAEKYAGCDSEDNEFYWEVRTLKDNCKYSILLKVFDRLSGYKEAVGEFKYECSGNGGVQYFNDKTAE